MTKLSQSAENLINSYLNLKIAEETVPCPYFNNKKSKIRGGLKALVGKGKPDEIAEEASIIALKQKIDLKNLEKSELTKFLVDNNLGIDCSALAFYILDAELGGLKKHIKIKNKNFFRKILNKFRLVENVSVEVLKNNSIIIELKKAKPGDMIIILNAGENKNYNHVLVVHEVDDNIVKYTHSIEYKEDSRYSHGIRQGEIEILDYNKNILSQKFSEPELERYLKTAGSVEVMRIR